MTRPTNMTAAEYRALPKKRRHKYGAKKTVVDGITFDSKAESEEYARLKQLERVGHVRKLKLQPRYPLVVDGLLICHYVADFAYFDMLRGGTRVIDVKGVRTPEYLIKKKLFEALYRQRIDEVGPAAKPKRKRIPLRARLGSRRAA